MLKELSLGVSSSLADEFLCTLHELPKRAKVFKPWVDAEPSCEEAADAPETRSSNFPGKLFWRGPAPGSRGDASGAGAVPGGRSRGHAQCPGYAFSSKIRFDERFADFERCLLLDGYAVFGGVLRRTDPNLAGAPPVEDDLIAALLESGAASREEIGRKVQESAQAFRSVPPDYNAALTNARVALETVARDVAANLLAPGEATPYDPTRWGSVITFQKTRGEISQDEEVGLASVYRILSPGAHRPVGVSEEQLTRLGRTFALNMCWFLLLNHLARSGAHP